MTAAAAMREQFWQVRFFATLFGGFALVALGLAAIGIYGLLDHLVTQRTREIGVRLALGADARRVMRLILGRGLLLGTLGISVGLALSWGAGQVLRSLLFGTDPLDPLVLAGASGVFALVVLLASFLPARRAARVEPVEALRAE
jgi:ABC-type antimicrobial peptide transport system permease subunit